MTAGTRTSRTIDISHLSRAEQNRINRTHALDRATLVLRGNLIEDINGWKIVAERIVRNARPAETRQCLARRRPR